jgi:hypothetical protein
MQIDLMNEIKQCWKNKSTGALFIKLSNKRLLQLFFVSGELLSAKCRGNVGMQAIKDAAFVEPISSQFYLGVASQSNNNFPPTAHVIHMLNANSFERAPIKKAAAPAAVPAPASSAEVSVISEADQVVINDVLVDCIGPIADIIFSEELQSVSSVESLIESLSAHIDDVESQVKFRREVVSKLK